jgi:hypothetical protein
MQACCRRGHLLGHLILVREAQAAVNFFKTDKQDFGPELVEVGDASGISTRAAIRVLSILTDRGF